MPTTYAIIQGNKYMDATTYSGAGGNSTVTNAGVFKPDLVWVKSRTDTGSHVLQDSVRGFTGATKLSSNSTNAENNNAADATDPIYGWVTNVTSSGFSVYVGTTPSEVNKSGQNYVGWQWQAGQGTSANNTSGTITSTVSANTTAGFNIVTFTGNGSSGATVGHGLGAVPSLIILKSRSNAYGWSTYSSVFGGTYLLKLNTNAAATNSGVTGYWNNTNATSSVFTIGNDAEVNTNGGAYVAYCWTPIPGFSAFGSYTGNGSADGPFVYTGFQPKYILIKNSTTGGTGYDWTIWDSARNPYNVGPGGELYADTSGAEVPPGQIIDILSNGFKIRSSGGRINGTSGTLIYAAFASTPFKYSNSF